MSRNYNNKTNEKTNITTENYAKSDNNDLKKTIVDNDLNEKELNSKQQNDDLKNELDALKAQMILLMNNVNNANSASSSNEDILVISMCNWVLNLSTEPMGAGNIYKFNHFGEEQMIPKDDLKRIIKVNPKFTKDGLFYIADENFIKSEKLTTAYSKILDINSMVDLLNSNKSNFEKIFKSLSATQKDTFIDLVCKKLINNEEVDMNIVAICSDISKRNILEEVNQAKAVLNETK